MTPYQVRFLYPMSNKMKLATIGTSAATQRHGRKMRTLASGGQVCQAQFKVVDLLSELFNRGLKVATRHIFTVDVCCGKGGVLPANRTKTDAFLVWDSAGGVIDNSDLQLPES
jgi:hypothetical protein